jgi:acetoin utilization deacetylase AcuC-like enzyme
MITEIPVAFTEKMLGPMKPISPSAAKPSQVVASWNKMGYPLHYIPVAPVTEDEFSAAHNPKFVKDIFNHRRPNGFGDIDPRVTATLPYTSGAMLSAARYILQNKLPVGVAPCSGFHHAGWNSPQGFCTFNGLMVTAQALLNEGLADKVGILDCDMHYGNGTEDIINHFELHDDVVHITIGENEMDSSDALRFLSYDLLNHIENLSDCDIVLYQAGADPHIQDPLGGWLTTEQLYLRDRRVFELLNQKGIPVVWNLAGGYQVERDGSIPKVLEIHNNTMRACAETYL